MKEIVAMVALLACIAGVPGPSDADPVHWSLNFKPSSHTDKDLLSGAHLFPSGQAYATGFPEDRGTAATLEMMGVQSFETCLFKLSVCMPHGRLDTMLLLTDQTTLIGHLTLDEYASLAEIATVTEMYLTGGALTVRFLGGAWPGSVLSVFETSFPL